MPDCLIKLENIDYAYQPGRPVLEGLDFCLAPNERVALLGANGSGKTTLLHLIVGLLKPQEGIVRAFGNRCRMEKDFEAVRRRVGLLFQDPDDQLFCATVAEDVAFGPLNLGKGHDEAMKIVREVLAQLGLNDYEDRITYKLSGGEKRLVSLATVLAMRPDVLLLDEPTSGLDEDTRERITGILRELPQSMVIISHDRGFLDQVTSRLVHLHEGRLTAGPRIPNHPA